MSRPAFEPLPRPVRCIIKTVSFPFDIIGYLFAPLVNTLYRSDQFLRRVCRQNWVFLRIFYLHLWQLLLDSAMIRPIVPHWKRIVATTLFTACAVPAGLILYSSIRIFVTYWSTPHAQINTATIQALALFLLTCAPACAVLSAATTAAYFAWKRHKHGAFEANMRRAGRKGYWADPGDVEEWRKWESRGGSCREASGMG